MNSTIKHVLLSIALVQMGFQTVSAEAEKEGAEIVAKGYTQMAREGFASVGNGFASVGNGIVSVGTTVKTFAAPYVPAFVTSNYNKFVAPQLTLQNGKYAVGTAVVAAGLYAAYKYYSAPDKNPFLTELKSAVRAKGKNITTAIAALEANLSAKAKGLFSTKAEGNKPATDLKTQLLTRLAAVQQMNFVAIKSEKQAILGLEIVKNNSELSGMIKNYFADLGKSNGVRRKHLVSIEVCLKQIK